MILTIFDVDLTLIDKRQLDDKNYRRLSKEVFNIEIPMMTHPLTGKFDPDFATLSKQEIWEKRLREFQEKSQLSINPEFEKRVLYQGGIINYKELVNLHEEYVLKELEGQNIEKVVTKLIGPEQIATLPSKKNPVTVATTGSRAVQERVLRDMGYFDYGIDNELAAYAEDGEDKMEIIERAAFNYVITKGMKDPILIFYITASANEVRQGVNMSKKGTMPIIPIGVATGISDTDTLDRAGAVASYENLKRNNFTALQRLIKHYEKNI